MSRPLLGLVLAAVLLLAGCGGAQPLGSVQPRDGRSGLQLTGTLDGRQVTVADGLPDLQVANCNPNAGPGEDVCAISRTIDGAVFVLVIDNPAALEEGRVLDVADPGCATACEDVDDVAVVDVQVHGGARQRAIGGRLELTVVDPPARYAGRLSLQLPGGRLTGSFDLVPRPD